jgi:glyoxylase-like metal-dependent hydrolase (beta-lactamase superfamily II)
MKVYFLNNGFATAPAFFMQMEGWKRVRIPTLSVLIENEGELVLFDCGLGTRIKDDMKPLIYRGNWLTFNIGYSKYDQEKYALVRQLPNLGFDPSGVKHVIISHLHWDHAGGMRDFPQAHHIVNRREWDSAVSGKGMNRVKGGYIKEQFEGAGLDIELVTMDVDRPYNGFPASYDVFDDGSMVMVELPGHTKGQVGMFLNLPSGRRFLFSGDAFHAREGFEKRTANPKLVQVLVNEGPEAEGTLETLYQLSQDEPDLEIVGSHDDRIPGLYDLCPACYE